MKEGRRVPTIHELPKGHPARDAVARQIIKARRHDRESREALAVGVMTVREDPARYNQAYEIDPAQVEKVLDRGWFTHDRSGIEYIYNLSGLEATFEYIKTLDSNLVLDIGTGTSRGISEIAKSGLGAGLQFKGTSTTPQPEFKDYLGRDNIIITSAESLQGIKSNSVGGVLGVHSVSYSAEPMHLLARLDQILVGGGIIKIVVANLFEPQHFSYKEKGVEEFMQAFRDIGYDVANDSGELGDIVLAIKPSTDRSKSAMRAKDLIEQDKKIFLNDEW